MSLQGMSVFIFEFIGEGVKKMEKRSVLESELNRLFRLEDYDRDPSFSRFIPMVYDPIGFDWKNTFEPDFVQRFNGLMIKGAEVVRNVYLAVFPTDDVLKRFLEQSQEGDRLFMHHPLLMECGDPKGRWGRGFVPIKKEWIDFIKKKKLSVYTCHIPMDLNREIGTIGKSERMQLSPNLYTLA